MINNSKYKPVIAALLLGLYAFIITPTNLWHHHLCDAAEYITHTGEDNVEYAGVTAASTPEGQCQVCSHKYSDIGNIDLFPIEKVIPARVEKNGHHILRLIAIAPSISFNKGPPVTI